MSLIPPNWAKVRFDKFAENITTRIDNPGESGLDDYVGLEHLDPESIRIHRYGSPSEVNATKFLCKKGDIIFGKRRAYLRKCAISGRDAVVSAHSMVLRPKNNEIYPDFFPWIFQTDDFWTMAIAISEGSLSPTIKWKTIAKQEFLLPGIQEQRRIAEILWAIENNLEKTENLIQVTEKLRKELLEELLTKGIGHKEFKKTELGEIPEEWKIERLDECLSINEETLSEKTKPERKINYIDISSIEQTGIISQLQEMVFSEAPSRARRIVRKGDVIISTVRPNLKAFAPIKIDTPDLVCSTGFAVLRPKEKVLQDFVFYYSLTEIFMKQVSPLLVGSNYPAINQSELKSFKIALPTIYEQKVITEIIDSTDNFLSKLISSLKELSVLKKKLTNSFLSGELLIPKEALK